MTLCLFRLLVYSFTCLHPFIERILYKWCTFICSSKERTVYPWLGWAINITEISKVLKPNWKFLPKQDEARKATFEYPFTVYSGAVGAGKTILLSHMGIQTCINYPGCTGMACSLTYTQLKGVLFHTLRNVLKQYQEILDKNNIGVKLVKSITESPGNMKIEFYNGSRIIFLPATAEEKIRGYTIDFFLIDEPIEIDEQSFTQIIARMRGQALVNQGRRTFGILATNPGAETHWIYQRFYASNHNDYTHVDTSTYDNLFLDKSYIRQMEESYDEDWIRRFLKGKWGAFEGQIYKEFNPDRHVGDYQNPPDIKYYIAGVDYGSRNPGCIVTIGIAKKGKAYIIEEWYGPDTSVNMAKRLESLNKKYNYKKIYIDPSQLDLITQCQSLHLPAEGAENKVDPGITKIKSLLSKDLLLVDKRCKNVIAQFQSYRYERDKMNKNHTEKPLKKDDHAMDAVRYGLYSLKIWKSPVSIRWGHTSLWNY